LIARSIGATLHGGMETAITLIVWAGLVLIGPPALLFWLVRRRRRRERAAAEAAATAALAPPPAAIEAAPSDAPEEAQQTGNGYSFPYGVPLVIYPILAVALPMVRHNVWLTALVELLLLALAVAFTRLAFDRAEFDKTRDNDPGMNLPTWRINWLLFFAAPPAVLALFGAVSLLKQVAG
jgi:hypothetical protein